VWIGTKQECTVYDGKMAGHEISTTMDWKKQMAHISSIEVTEGWCTAWFGFSVCWCIGWRWYVIVSLHNTGDELGVYQYDGVKLGRFLLIEERSTSITKFVILLSDPNGEVWFGTFDKGISLL
jgi:hypothetical protein